MPSKEATAVIAGLCARLLSEAQRGELFGDLGGMRELGTQIERRLGCGWSVDELVGVLTHRALPDRIERTVAAVLLWRLKAFADGPPARTTVGVDVEAELAAAAAELEAGRAARRQREAAQLATQRASAGYSPGEILAAVARNFGSDLDALAAGVRALGLVNGSARAALADAGLATVGDELVALLDGAAR